MLDIFIPALITLFVIIDPLGLMPMFAVITKGGDAAFRRSMALKGSVIASVVLIMFALLGESLLGVFGITMGAFRIAGGLLLFVTAFEMIFQFRAKRRSHTAEAATHTPPAPEDISVFPLAFPFLAGPGAITSIILLTSPHRGDWLATGVIIAALLVAMIASYVLFLVSARLMAVLGVTVTMVITRLLGVILAALAIQFIVDGVKLSIG